MNSSANNHLSTVLITGGTDGLGRAAAILLAEEGYHVFAAGRDPQKRAALEQFAEEHELPLETLDLDVNCDGSAGRAVAEIGRRAGAVDVLVNNAGIAIVAVMEEISLDDLRKQMETNVIAAVRMAQHVLPSMREQRRGRIINMSSIAGKTSNPLMGPYSASKHAIEAISDAMRMELAQFGIHVVLIEPGFIPTNMGQASAELSTRYVQNAGVSPYARTYSGFLQMWRKVMNRTRSKPEDCARVVLQAIRADSPRPRYLVTREAKITAAMRWFLSDRRMDQLTLRMLGMHREVAATALPQNVQAEVEEMVRPRT
ncbi:MAG TPA: SDR family oxidoreductase [Candidatus Acidoferrales bacterium]|nr:SDR family oxidoreductase [Candidatus Acidoferrales bacterium]